VTPASDVYALGLVLYRLLAGSPPWRTGSVAELFDAHRFVGPAPLPADLPGVPAAVRVACMRCLAKDPRQRPTAGEVARIVAAAAGRPGPGADSAGRGAESAVGVGASSFERATVASDSRTAVRAVRVPSGLKPRRTRRRRLLAGVALAAAATLALGFLAATAPSPPTATTTTDPTNQSGRSTRSSGTLPGVGANTDSKARYTGVPDFSSQIAKTTCPN
jgi:serine/threonine-protein kinase